MESVLQIKLSPEELLDLMQQAVTKGVAAGFRLAKDELLQDAPITKEEFKKLAGYQDEGAFRAFCKTNQISPHEIKARKHYYLPSQLDGIQHAKGVHRR